MTSRRIVPLAPLLCLLAFLPGSFIRSEDAPPPSPVPPETPAPEAIPVLDPAKLDEVRARVGQVVVLEGLVDHIGVSKSGDVFYVNFSADHRLSASLVLFDRSTAKETTKSALDALIGVKVRAQGRLEEYKGGLQVKVAKPADITKL